MNCNGTWVIFVAAVVVVAAFNRTAAAARLWYETVLAAAVAAVVVIFYQHLARLMSYLWTVWPDWAICWTLGNFLKSLATINLSKSPTFLGNFVKVLKSIIFLVKSFLGNFYGHLAIFSGHTGWDIDIRLWPLLRLYQGMSEYLYYIFALWKALSVA